MTFVRFLNYYSNLVNVFPRKKKKTKTIVTRYKGPFHDLVLVEKH